MSMLPTPLTVGQPLTISGKTWVWGGEAWTLITSAGQVSQSFVATSPAVVTTTELPNAGLNSMGWLNKDYV